jgi:hypothetical protein
MSELVPEGYIKDPETGYLVAQVTKTGTPFGVETKKRVIEMMKEEGSISILCQKLGVSTRSVYDHLQIDEAFRRDYALAIQDNCSTLEGTMFKNGQRPQGYMDRITYLRRWKPNEWTPKTQITVSQDNSSVESLFKALEDTGKVINITPDSV